MARKTRTTPVTPAKAPVAFTLTAVSVRPTFTHKPDAYEGAPRAVRLYRDTPVVVGGGKLWRIAKANGASVTLAPEPVCDAPADVGSIAPAAKAADLARLGFAPAKPEPAKPAPDAKPEPAATTAKPSLTEIAKAMRDAGFPAADVMAALAAHA